MFFEKLLPALTLAACLVLLVRMVLPPEPRARLDAAGRWAWRQCTLAWHALVRVGRSLRRRGPSRREAERAAEEAIRRARGGGVRRDGNVYRPDSFRGPRKPH